MAIRLCVLGPTGRMGRELCAAATAHKEVELRFAVARPGSAQTGQTTDQGVKITDDLGVAFSACDAYIDFTNPEATARAAELAQKHRVAAIIGTTGLDSAAQSALGKLAQTQPVLIAPNFSLGVNLILHLAKRAASALGPEFDLEVIEAHHKRKRDSPSGTALALGRALAEGRGIDFDGAAVYERHGDIGPRKSNEIGMAVIRGGDIVGEHTALLIGEDERVEITHRAGKRSIFANGAVHAAAFLAGKPAGHYQMADVLGLAD